MRKFLKYIPKHIKPPLFKNRNKRVKRHNFNNPFDYISEHESSAKLIKKLYFVNSRHLQTR